DGLGEREFGILKKLADLGMRLVLVENAPKRKRALIDETTKWISRYENYPSRNETPAQKIFTAARKARLKEEESKLVADKEKKKSLLIDAYSSMESVRDLVLSGDEITLFRFHSKLGTNEKKIYLACGKEEEEERRRWLRKWLTETDLACKFAAKLGKTESVVYRLYDIGLAISYFADMGNNPSGKLSFYRSALRFAERAQKKEETLEEKNMFQDMKILMLKAKSCKKRAELYGYGKANMMRPLMRMGFDFNEEALKIAKEEGFKDHVIINLCFCAQEASALRILDFKGQLFWKMRASNLYREAGDRYEEIKETDKAEHMYRLASNLRRETG
ncbi:MAG: hypothetical protein Q8Q41_02450, partial [bacterium]|nr:hypothetical protein [bacterium]